MSHLILLLYQLLGFKSPRILPALTKLNKVLFPGNGYAGKQAHEVHPQRCAGTLKGAATQTKPAFAGYKNEAREGGLRFCSRTLGWCRRRFAKLTCSRSTRPLRRDRLPVKFCNKRSGLAEKWLINSEIEIEADKFRVVNECSTK